MTRVHTDKMKHERPDLRFGSSRVLTQEAIAQHAAMEAAKPQTKTFLSEFKHAVRYSKDGKKYRARLSGKDRAKFREMQRPLVKLQQEQGLRANAQEGKRMFVNPTTGKKSYVFESMVEGIERRTGMRAKRTPSRRAEHTVYKKMSPGLHTYTYRGDKLIRHDIFKSDIKSNTLKLVKSRKYR